MTIELYEDEHEPHFLIMNLIKSVFILIFLDIFGLSSVLLHPERIIEITN